MTRAFAGVDVGGTFTDVVLATDDGRTVVRKLLTTHEDPRVAVVDGLQGALADADVAPDDVVRVVHGTTLATNVILERRGGRIAFVTTAGFGDLLRLGREARVEDDRFDLFFTTPQPPVEEGATFEAEERSSARGEALTALTPEHAQEVAARIAAVEPVAVAICFLHAYANPAHEQLMAEACRAAMPGTFVVTSSDVWPELREYERAMTTVMCAYVGPIMGVYLSGLGERLASMGVRCGVEIMESSGSVMSADLAARRPIYTVESGGAAGVTAAGAVGELAGVAEVISFDMGGTTAKAAVVRGGRPSVVHDLQIGGKGSFGGARPGTGFPVKVPVVDMAEVGAGGGSIAWIDDGGALRVGPKSAGSVPGPACYGGGGDAPTVTDANLVLGYVNPAGLAGGVSLSRELAELVLRRDVADPLGLDLVEAARAVHELANVSMASAIHMVTVQRGVDPRGFALVAFGGAGPTHVTGLAESFGIGTIVVPWAAGVASAVGLVNADLGVERIRTWVGGDLDAAYRELEDACREELGGGDVVFHRAADARFVGQAHQLVVPVDDVDDIAERFRKEHARAYGVDSDGPVEVVNLRVRAVRRTEKPPPHPESLDIGVTVEPRHQRETLHGVMPVYDRADLVPGASLSGPLLVDAPDTTIVVPARWQADVDEWRNVVLRSTSTG